MATPITKRGGTLKVPDKDEKNPSVISAFMDRVGNFESPYLREYQAECLTSKLMVETHQWLTYQGTDPARSIQITSINEDEEDIAITTTNEILPIVDTERSRLGKRRSTFHVRTRRGDNRRADASAAKGDEILDYTQEQMAWQRIYRQHVFRDVMYGTGVLRSEWLTDYRKTVKVGKLTAMRCSGPACDFKVAQPKLHENIVKELPPDKLGMLHRRDNFDGASGEVDTEYGVTQCLMCGAPMTDPGVWVPSQGAEARGKDFFGQPLGADQPIGEPMITSIDPRHFIPENEGIGLEPGPMGRPGSPNWYFESQPESLDNIAAWYQRGEDVAPEDPETIARSHPFMGEHGHSSKGWRGVNDRTVYQSHARLRRFAQGPTRAEPLGRFVIMGGRKILLNADLMIESEQAEEMVPRVGYHACRFFLKEGEFLGQGLPVPLRSPQNRENMTFSQIVDNREHNGNDGWLMTKGMRVSSPGWAKGVAGRISYWEPDPENPDKEPRPSLGRLMDATVYKELEFTIARMQYIAGIMDVDVGKNPGGVTAATAIEMLGEKSAERREAREAELVETCRDAWRHVAKLQREKVREPRKYVTKGAGDLWDEKEYTGEDLVGQDDLEVVEEPNYDKKAFDREMTIKGLELGLLPMDTAYARREARKELGLESTNIADTESVQVDDAERKWQAFLSERKVPAIDPNEDEHQNHWDIYGMGWKSEDGVRLKAEARWDEILKVIAGWDRTFQAQKADEAEFETLVLTGQLEQLVQTVQQADQAEAQTQGAVPANPGLKMTAEKWTNFTPPPPAIEDHILQIWGLRLQEAGMVPDEKQQLVMRMKAVHEAHLVHAQARKAAIQGGAPLVAAPAGQQTEAGTEPGPGEQVA